MVLGDTALRAITDDQAFRVMTVSTTDTVRATIAAQRAHGPTAGILGALVTGAVLVRERMAPDLRVQLVLQCSDGKSRVVADAYPRGEARGLVQTATNRTLPRGEAKLAVMRTLHDGSVHQGVVSVPAGGGVS